MHQISKLFEIFQRKEHRTNCSYVYVKKKNKNKFKFISDIELCEADLPIVIDIIDNNLRKNISVNRTAEQIFYQFNNSVPDVAATDILTTDGGKHWLIQVSTNPLAFRS